MAEPQRNWLSAWIAIDCSWGVIRVAPHEPTRSLSHSGVESCGFAHLTSGFFGCPRLRARVAVERVEMTGSRETAAARFSEYR